MRDAGRYARLPTLTVSPLAARGLRPEAEPARGLSLRSSGSLSAPYTRYASADSLRSRPLRGVMSEEVNEESRQASDVRSGWTEAGPVTTKKPT